MSANTARQCVFERSMLWPACPEDGRARWIAASVVRATARSGCARAGFQVFAGRAADSRSQMLEHALDLGRRLPALHRKRSPRVARGHYALAQRAANSYRVQRRAVRNAGIAMDAIEFYPAADDGAGAVFL